MKKNLEGDVDNAIIEFLGVDVTKYVEQYVSVSMFGDRKVVAHGKDRELCVN